MFYLGIDIGKNTHVASLIDDKKKVIFKAFSFSNSIDRANSLLEKLSPFTQSLEIGMEATGHYWLSIYSFFIEKTFLFTLLILSRLMVGVGIEIRKRKTDIIDSILIADLLRYVDFIETSLSNEDYLSLRNLTRFRSYLISSVGDLKRKTIAVLDQVFPEYASSFSNIFGKSSKEILISISTPQDFENITADKIEQISFIENQVATVEQEISILMGKINSPITSIPGVGLITGAVILGEIGDISRFSNPSKLVAYAGLDAAISQSGEFESSSNRMSKRGSPYLRKALFQSALRAEFCDSTFSNYYQKKIFQGKHHLVATNAVARKLCHHTIFAILSKNESYLPQM